MIQGLENYGYDALARRIALNDLNLVSRVFQKTGTIWENYAPDAVRPGHPARRNFVGWSGIAPIAYLLQYAIGLRPNAPQNELVWQLQPGGRSGCKRYRFANHIVTLVAAPEAGNPNQMRIRVQSDGPFQLLVRFQQTQKTFNVASGKASSSRFPLER